ncbi:homoserine O-acetyltransferase MetX [Candidatus Spyradosoma sp. SGI.093]|uniref:homoserine O-acetyltransferase MetX n=1 Tax=Candidatus Spyradosoma sp. SGI.093 TaxID=3420583 RepID=UPI003D059035
MTDDDELTQEINGEGASDLVSPQDFVYDRPFEFELGGSIPNFTLRYETYGALNADKSNAILICHALTGDHHVAGRHRPEDKRPGWWDHFIGPGKAVDTRKYFVICSNCLGGCSGSTGPTSVNPETGDPYGIDFPVLTFRDMVRAQKLLIDSLGIRRLHAVIGGSMGGMQALIWEIEFPDMVKNVIAMACAAKQNTQATAFNSVARAAITQDPNWLGGYYGELEGTGPRSGLAVARMMAHITYLSDFSLTAKIRREKSPELPGGRIKTGEFLRKITFPIESYLHHQGEKFLDRFDANSYLYITAASDFFNLAKEHSLDQTFACVKARTLVVGFSTDWLYPPWQNREIVIALKRAGKDARYVEIEAVAGHDSFLLNSPHLYETTARFLEEN